MLQKEVNMDKTHFSDETWLLFYSGELASDLSSDILIVTLLMMKMEKQKCARERASLRWSECETTANDCDKWRLCRVFHLVEISNIRTAAWDN